MSTEVIAAIVAGGIAYPILAGVSWQLGGAHWNDPGPFFCAVLWPVILPAILGARIARRLTTRGVQLPKAQVIP